jgi:predicted ABC-type ATPase
MMDVVTTPNCKQGNLMQKPVLWFVAGADGVGKTSYAFKNIYAVTGSKSFINVDEIASGLSPINPEAGNLRARRIALQILAKSLTLENGVVKSLTVESALAGRTHLKTIEDAQNAGRPVHILYFAVKSPEIALARIARRVSVGGHDVPEIDARRRFSRSLASLPEYLAACDFWRVYDNNAAQPVTVAEGRQGCVAFRSEDWSGMPDGLTEFLSVLPKCAEG